MIHTYKEHYINDATRSGVKLRSIQQYESRAKGINKFAAETL